MAKKYCSVCLFSMISKVFENLVNSRLVDHIEKCGLISDFQYGFRSSQSTFDYLTVSDRTAKVLIHCRLSARSGMLVFFTS